MSKARKARKTVTVPDDLDDEDQETRWCDQGCGYKLPEEYAENETTCGACLNEDEG